MCESSLGIFCKAKDAKFLDADKEESNQIARMRRLICVSVGRIYKTIFFFSHNSVQLSFINR